MALEWGFKEIFWDSGAIWVLMLIMALVWLFDVLRNIRAASKGKNGE